MFILSALLGLFFKNHNGVFIENMSSYVGEFVLGNLLLFWFIDFLLTFFCAYKKPGLIWIQLSIFIQFFMLIYNACYLAFLMIGICMFYKTCFIPELWFFLFMFLLILFWEVYLLITYYRLYKLNVVLKQHRNIN